ncbi:MAG TPA: putative toxin-antitoxin system toxin component, PIN family [Terriglobales bacterium]|nr:putative toxin-antitoxin system toxin component, PIN family [Terriglobales bacterium]
MLPLRLVLDTNIVISAALKPEGAERTILLFALTKPARCYVSNAILDEYAAVLARPELRIRKGQRLQLLQWIRNRATVISPKSLPQITTDLEDNIFIECADSARADYIVSGNLRHFPKFWKNTKIINSREFLAVVAPHLEL